MSNFLSALFILEIRLLSDVGLVNIFSHSVGCLFVLLTVSLALQKLLSFRRTHLFIVALSICATGVIIRKYFLWQCIEGYFPISLLSCATWSDLY